MQRYNGGGALPPKPKWQDILVGFLGGTLGIFGLYGLSLITEYPVLLAPFGASCALLFAAPHAPFAQPRNVMAGFFVSTLIALVMAMLLGTHPLVIATSVGLAIAVMQVLRVMHPPGGAVPLVVMLVNGPVQQPLDTMVSIFIGAIYLVLLALLLNSIGREKRWPHYWWGKRGH